MRAIWAGAFWFTLAGAGSAEDATALYSGKVRPALEKHCYGCHGVGQTLASLDLRTREGMLKGGGRGPSLEAGHAGRSLLYRAVTATGDLQMPPGKDQKLPDDVIAAIRLWIDGGAPVAPAAGGAKKWDYKPEDLWAFQPLRKAPPPDGLDGFIRAKLGARGVKPAPPADRRTLIRRATFDLTGLPPAPEEVEAFLRDAAPGAFDRVIERLLASPRYGERWGRHWLDVVRYADTDGYSNDFERPNAWRYRDYVIRSFQQDKPYDRFILEQIAGDELDPGNPEHLVATGFLRMGPWEQTAMSVAAVTRQQWLDDVTHNTATVFLGLTMGCARCHDHKFDPIPTSDYYSLQAVFASTHFDQPAAAFRNGEAREDYAAEAGRIGRLIQWNEARLRELDQKVTTLVMQKHGLKSAAELPAGVLKKALQSHDGLDAGDLERERIYRKRLEIYRRELQRYRPLAYGVKTGAPEETHILVAGNLRSPGELVRPAVVSAGWQYAPQAKAGMPETPAGRRLALARWIASPTNPLTARVMVNRIWQYHFGKALAANPNNFGKMGKKPTHPELLDYLAGYFIDNGWSVKAMHRLILRSATYQRASEHPEARHLAEADPANELYAFFPPRRIEAEVLRDSMLAVAGELDFTMGGPGTFPEINQDVAHQPRLIMGTLAPVWQPSPKRAQRNRRTVYTYQKRGIPDPMLEVFNAPGSSDSCERRDATTVPTQVFSLLNGRLARDTALAFAARVSRTVTAPRRQVEEMVRLAYQRPPAAEEKALLEGHLATMTEYHTRVEPPAPPKREPLVRSLIGEYTGKRFDYLEEGSSEEYEANLHSSEVGPATRALAEVALVLFNSNEFVYVY